MDFGPCYLLGTATAGTTCFSVPVVLRQILNKLHVQTEITLVIYLVFIISAIFNQETFHWDLDLYLFYDIVLQERPENKI